MIFLTYDSINPISHGGGASEAAPQHFCDCSGTVIARTLKFLTFRKAKLSNCYEKNFIEFLFFTPPMGTGPLKRSTQMIFLKISYFSH